jgi:hypothetical protein
MRYTDLELTERELARIRQEQTDLLLSMELHYDRDTAEDFEWWWFTEGNFRKYHELGHEIELLEEKKSRLSLFQQLRTRKIQA